MAKLCNIFLIAIGISLLAGQVSYGHELFGVSLNEDERQSCSDTNCLGKDPCSGDEQCSPNKCCIDMINSLTCCHESGEPVTTTTTTESPTTTNVGESPLCTDYYGNPCPTPEDCACIEQNDCYPDEVCCLEITTEEAEIHFKLFCHSTIPPATTIPPGAKCPTTTPPLECAPLHDPGSCTEQFGPTCRANEICCTLGRDELPCCVVYPPETFNNQSVYKQKTA